jgi:hypothetical protein
MGMLVPIDTESTATQPAAFFDHTYPVIEAVSSFLYVNISYD